MLKAIWQAWQDVNNLLDDPAWIERERQAGAVCVATGNWLIEDANRRSMSVPMVGAASVDDSIDEDEAIGQLVNFIDRQGVAVPMASAEQSRRERILALIEIAMPLLLKLLVK